VRSGADLRAGVGFGTVRGSAKEEPMADETKPGGAWDATQWHEVKPGDTLWKIAEQYYGDGSLYTKIFEANKDVLDDPNKIKVGQKLRIP
jgi:nucleoid-associated protein YgaU